MPSSPYSQHPAGNKKIRLKLELLRFLAVILAYVAAGRLAWRFLTLARTSA